MDASAHRNPQDLKERDDDSAAVGLAYAAGGFIVGVVCTGLSLLSMGVAITVAQFVTGSEVCADGFSKSLTGGLVVFGLAISLFVGYRLFRWRRFIGDKGGSEKDVAYGSMLRKRFTYASMLTYCLLAPFSWMFMFAAANCAAR